MVGGLRQGADFALVVLAQRFVDAVAFHPRQREAVRPELVEPVGEQFVLLAALFQQQCFEVFIRQQVQLQPVAGVPVVEICRMAGPDRPRWVISTCSRKLAPLHETVASSEMPAGLQPFDVFGGKR